MTFLFYFILFVLKLLLLLYVHIKQGKPYPNIKFCINRGKEKERILIKDYLMKGQMWELVGGVHNKRLFRHSIELEKEIR